MASQTTIQADQLLAGGVAPYCDDLVERSRAAAKSLAKNSGRQRNHALHQIAQRLLDATDRIKQANVLDLEAGRSSGLTGAMIERLELSDQKIAAMAESVRQIAEQTDPIGQIECGRVLPNGLRLQKLRVPLGVILFIYESRPAVTSDAAALCLKSGNAIILRGGKEARCSNGAIAKCVRNALEENGIMADAVQLVETTDRAAVGVLLQMENKIDLCIPRGGKSLIQTVVEQARIPVIKHYTGNCHTYVDGNSDEQMAVCIAVNGKIQRPSVCNATETILIHRDAVERGLLDLIGKALLAEGVEIRGDIRTCANIKEAKPATEQDWHEEYLDLVVAIRIVDSIEDAIRHINDYGSHHTDSIVTNTLASADSFVQQVDSANVFVNCSTRFSDGFQYGLGAEIGISTDKLHARGPMGAEDLTTTKWIASGNGQVRS